MDDTTWLDLDNTEITALEEEIEQAMKEPRASFHVLGLIKQYLRKHRFDITESVLSNERSVAEAKAYLQAVTFLMKRLDKWIKIGETQYGIGT